MTGESTLRFDNVAGAASASGGWNEKGLRASREFGPGSDAYSQIKPKNLLKLPGLFV